MKGFVFISDKKAESFKELYEWHPTDESWLPELDDKILNLDSSSSWKYSEDFNSAIKSSSFVGNFYIDFNHNLIYFDVQK